MKVSLMTLSKRRDDVLDALRRNEKISVSDGKEIVAFLISVKPESKNIPSSLPRTPAQGMWADRTDITDPTAWVREQRERRRQKRIIRHSVVENA